MPGRPTPCQLDTVMARSTISLPPLPDIAPDRLGPFEFGLLGDRYVLSNDAGDWAGMETEWAKAWFLEISVTSLGTRASVTAQ